MFNKCNLIGSLFEQFIIFNRAAIFYVNEYNANLLTQSSTSIYDAEYNLCCIIFCFILFYHFYLETFQEYKPNR